MSYPPLKDVAALGGLLLLLWPLRSYLQPIFQYILLKSSARVYSCSRVWLLSPSPIQNVLYRGTVLKEVVWRSKALRGAGPETTDSSSAAEALCPQEAQLQPPVLPSP